MLKAGVNKYVLRHDLKSDKEGAHLTSKGNSFHNFSADTTNTQSPEDDLASGEMAQVHGAGAISSLQTRVLGDSRNLSKT